MKIAYSNFLFRVLAIAALLLCTAAQAFAAESSPGSAFLRIERDANQQPLSMQTSIVRYQPAEGKAQSPQVDLVSAVHIGEGDYFEQLNELFKDYDAVLFELVAPKGVVPTKRTGPPASVVSAFQLGLTGLLGLEFQLDRIDYTKKNFVHADTTPEEFVQDMRDRGESVLSMFLRLMAVSYAHQKNHPNPMAEMQVMTLLFHSDPKERSRGLKRFMAEQFQSTDVLIEALNGKKGTTLIGGRNDAALKVLKEQLALGKKKLAIFYGGGHMVDFDRKLRSQFGLQPTSTTWLEAWDLTK